MLDSAGYRIEAVFDSTPVTTLPGDHVTLPGNWTVQQPDDGGSSSGVSRVYPTDGNLAAKREPEESSGGGTYVVTGTRVSSSAGEVILTIPLDGKGDATTQSAGKPVTLPTDLASSGSVEIKLPGNEAAPTQDGVLSGTVGEIVNEDSAGEASQKIIASDGTEISGSGLRFRACLESRRVWIGEWIFCPARQKSAGILTDGKDF